MKRKYIWLGQMATKQQAAKDITADCRARGEKAYIRHEAKLLKFLKEQKEEIIPI
jgi:hypothetical protein